VDQIVQRAGVPVGPSAQAPGLAGMQRLIESPERPKRPAETASAVTVEPIGRCVQVARADAVRT
jgi:hypothetical protein